MKRAIICLVLLASLTGAAAVTRRYDNARYGFSVCYPASLSAGKEAANADGKTFTDGYGFKASVWGENNLNGLTLSQAKKAEGVPEPRAAAEVSYDFEKGNVGVVSGLSGTNIFYTKIIKRADQFLILAVSYPKTRQSKYGSLTMSMSRCFTAG